MAGKKEEDVTKAAPAAEPDEKPGAPVEDVERSDRAEGAHALVKHYMWWSMGTGLIPFPLLDLGALAGVQLKMLHRLSGHYEVEFSENRGKSLISALVGTLTAETFRRSSFTSFLKSVPFLGFIGSISMPIYSGAVSYAVGKVFIMHFESGGTLLDFDPKKFKGYFAELYNKGKEVIQKANPKAKAA